MGATQSWKIKHWKHLYDEKKGFGNTTANINKKYQILNDILPSPIPLFPLLALGIE